MALCFLQHESEIRVPTLVKFGGSIQFTDEYSMKWFYFKSSLLVISSVLYMVCFISYGIEYGFKWWFTYYNYLNITFFIIYLISSLIITIRIYRYIKNNELPNCCKTKRAIRISDNEEELQDLSENENDHKLDPSHHDEHPSLYKDITMEQIKSKYLAGFVLCFQYISLSGLWCGAILYWMHEFEVDIFITKSSIAMQTVIITTNVIFPCFAIVEFFMSGFRLRYFGFIWPAFIMIIVIIINCIQIHKNNLNPHDYDDHLFTELAWKSDIESSVVTCFWSLAVLLIVNTSFTFIKNICLCKWSVQQRRNQQYPEAPEIGAEVEI